MLTVKPKQPQNIENMHAEPEHWLLCEQCPLRQDRALRCHCAGTYELFSGPSVEQLLRTAVSVACHLATRHQQQLKKPLVL